MQMIRCQTCGTENLDRSRYCDECGTKLGSNDLHRTDLPNLHPQTAETPIFQSTGITSAGLPPIVEEREPEGLASANHTGGDNNSGNRAVIRIERGDAAGTEFSISGDESVIGRWDADNGIFPDIDLDAYDQEAKVSRRHARILYRDGKYLVEDLGSTNGTYVNRGRRLLPGNAHLLADGDEIIVGKTFLRFHINN